MRGKERRGRESGEVGDEREEEIDGDGEESERWVMRGKVGRRESERGG